jgi:DNA-binding transcriptional LysR family regulator
LATPNNLAGIDVFVRAVKAGSFTAAANQLGVTKSAVAKSVAQLEARLGVRLLHRTTRRLSLTPEGNAFFTQCEAAVEQIREAEDVARSRATTLRGVLRVDMPAVFGRRVALPILLDILAAHPELRLAASFSDRVIDPIEEGVDLCLRFGELPDRTDLAARKLGEQRLIICGSPGYLSANGEPRSLEELGQHACIVGRSLNRPETWRLLGDDAKPVFFESSPAHQCSDGEAIIMMTLAGFGLCQMPESLLRAYINDGRLVAVLGEHCQVRSPFNAVWPVKRQMLPRVRVVVDELVRRANAGQF